MSEKDDFWKDLLGEDGEDHGGEPQDAAQPGFTIEYLDKSGHVIDKDQPPEEEKPAAPKKAPEGPAGGAAAPRRRPEGASSAGPERSAAAPRQVPGPAEPKPAQPPKPVPPQGQTPAAQSGMPVPAAPGASEPRQEAQAPKDFEVDFDFDKEYQDVHEKAVKRGRTKRTGCLGGIMYFAFVISVSLILACLGWMAATDVLGLGDKDQTVEVTIPKEIFSDKTVTVKTSSSSSKASSASSSKTASLTSAKTSSVSSKTSSVSSKTASSAAPLTKVVSAADIDKVSDILYKAGLIKYKWLFRLYSKFSSADQKIKAGTYQLNKNYDYRALVNGMTATGGTRVTVDITIPEGYTVSQIITLLAQNGVCDAAELRETMANTKFDYPFLDDSTLGSPKRLEGYLFPDTYKFYVGDTPSRVVGKLLANFRDKWTDAYQKRADELGYTEAQIVNIASMIEKEAGKDSERASIASVIYNRLKNPGAKTAGYLQIDATIYYAIEDTGAAFSTDYNSPYNTYKYKGLPPGPIANPGVASIKAALWPDSTEYFYYALGKDGKHQFFKTYDTFQKFLKSDQFAG